MGSVGTETSEHDSPHFDVLFIGAGGIVFGNGNVRWNHSSRLEELLGRRLRVVGIVDPSRERFEWVLEQKRDSLAVGCYRSTKHYCSIQEAASDIEGSDTGRSPNLIMLATPPDCRGTMLPGRDLEAQLIRGFRSKPAIFVEKPVSTARGPEPASVSKLLMDSGNPVAVGYMLRYLRVVQKAMRIIRENHLVVMNVSARYITAYQRIRKFDWWDKEKQCGPIVEQATHFCDLCRYLGGEVKMDTVRAIALEHDEPAGKLSHQAVDESSIPPENKIPRGTSAFWKYENGALGTLTHVIALHGIGYSNEIDVIADGYQLRLVDLYTEPRLFVRFPDDEREQMFHYPGDDPFLSELAAICSRAGASLTPVSDLDPPVNPKGVDTAENTEQKRQPFQVDEVLSSYEDAVKTYEFSWKIRTESEHR